LRCQRRYLLACLLILIAVPLLAQDDDEDVPEDAGVEAPASLTLNFDRQGGVDVSLSLPDTDKTSDTLPGVLAQTLHCPIGAVHHPDTSARVEEYQKNWSAARREKFRKQMEQYNRRQFQGRCDAALTRNDHVFQGDFDWSALTMQLRQIDVDQLSIYVITPKTEFREYTRENLFRVPFQASTSIYYRIPLAPNAKPAVLHIAFGFRSRDLQRALAILAGFLVVPVLLTLWMRRRALALAEVDPPAAWFGFFRTLNWLVLGSMLAWISSGFGSRQMLQDWIALQGFSMFKAAAADVAILVLPSFFVYLLCISLSYPVHAQLRGSQWTRREFFYRQLVTVGAQAVPLMLVCSAVQILGRQSELGVALLVLSVVALQVFVTLKLRVIQEFPQPLTTGELRDRVFALAGKLGVVVGQIFVVPAGKGQVANAYAARNRIVMFTDYLLEHLNKREVDGVAAHELGHLRHKHPAKLTFAFIGAIFLPFYFGWFSQLLVGLLMIPLGMIPDVSGRAKIVMHVYQGINTFEAWSQKDFVLLLLGMTGFFFLSRHFEHVADATAVRLTGNAEAQITGLLKISRLNLIPIRWGKASEGWLTHPSTVRRAHRMASVGALPPERLQQILGEYEAQGNTSRVVAPEDRYTVPIAGDPEKMRTAIKERSRTQAKLWINLGSYVLPIALFSFVIEKFRFSGYAALAAYFLGIAITAVFVMLIGVWLGEAGKAREKKRLIVRFEREKIPVGSPEDLVVGFAPGPHPRLYGAKYHWDSGFLVFAKDRLQFVGEQVKFSFKPPEIDGLVVARGGPSWWKFERVYLRWKTEDGQSGIFNLNSLEPGSVWHTRKRVRDLCARIQEWRQQPANYPETRPELANLKPLGLGQVTSISPAALGKFGVNMKVLSWLGPLAVGVSMLTHTGLGYLLTSIIVLRLIHSIPYWRYRDQVPNFSQASDSNPASKARTATASVGAP
jgi:Zn-dependent protease with chaperone function